MMERARGGDRVVEQIREAGDRNPVGQDLSLSERQLALGLKTGDGSSEYLLRDRTAGHLDRSAPHEGLTRRARRSRRVDLRVGGVQDDVVHAELRPRDLRDDRREALAALDPGGVDLGDRTPDAR
jgi:hypothetical protein